MAISTFIPTIWEARLLAHLDKALVYGNLCNRDYEGDIRNYGDTVKINQIGNVEVKDYTKGTPITVDEIDGTPTELHIDQQKYFAFHVDDVDAAQANVNLVDLKGALDDANVPTEGRWVVVPSWFYGLMLKDNRFVAAGTTKTDAVLGNGYIGSAAGFNIYQSNNVPSTSGAKYKILAGNNTGISFAQQLIKTEALRESSSVSDLLRGLYYNS